MARKKKKKKSKGDTKSIRFRSYFWTPSIFCLYIYISVYLFIDITPSSSSAPSPSEIPAAKPFWNLKTQQVQARNWRAGELVIWLRIILVVRSGQTLEESLSLPPLPSFSAINISFFFLCSSSLSVGISAVTFYIFFLFIVSFLLS